MKRDQFEKEGYVAPIRVLNDSELDQARSGLERCFAEFGRPLPKAALHKAHLLYEWADVLVHHPGVLDIVEELIGPDILCWTSNLFDKAPDHESFVSWHQDSVYPGLDPPNVVSCWIALTRSDPDSGCLRVVPGSHEWENATYVDTFSKDNMLSRGQVMQVDALDDQAVDICLDPGEMSVHKFAIAHGSRPNHSDHPRIGFVARYMSTSVKQNAHPESAMLVRGVDRYHHFVHEVPWRDQPSPVHAELEHVTALRAHLRNGFAARGNERPSQLLRLWFARNMAAVALGARRTWLRIRT